MTAQEQMLGVIVTEVRALVPPQLDFLVLVYTKSGEVKLTSVMYPDDMKTALEQYERAKEAAQAFLTNKPHPSFNPQN